MITFKLNGKKINMPSSWHDLTSGHYIGMLERKTSDISETISILTGIDISLLKEGSFTGLDMVLQCLSFLNETPVFSASVKKVGKYELPLNNKGEFNIQFESLAQFEDMKAVMKKMPQDNALEITKAYIDYVAIYLQKIRDGKYNYDEAMKMKSEVLTMPAHEVLPAGSFFLTKLLSLMTGTKNSSPTTSQNPKKKKPVSVSSKKRSARSQRSSKRR